MIGSFLTRGLVYVAGNLYTHFDLRQSDYAFFFLFEIEIL